MHRDKQQKGSIKDETYTISPVWTQFFENFFHEISPANQSRLEMTIF